MADLSVNTFTQYFTDAVQTCFSTQANVKMQTSPSAREKAEGDLISNISFSSPEANGSVSLIFPAPVFLKIVNSMLGENETAITESNADAASELLNIVYGLARPKMNQLGFNFLPAIPTVVFGSGLSINSSKTHSFLSEVASDAGTFFISGSLTFPTKGGNR